VEPLFLTLDEILEIHQQQVDLYGGAAGVRDLGGLESALAQPAATFGGEFLHGSIPAMAAAYLFHLCQNHPFIDGNKRTGANAAVTFLLMNGWAPEFEWEELVQVVLSVASGVMEKRELIRVFEKKCRMAEGA
jgi:death-on-curing protein